ncbi:MAG: octaprenyl-diphosphate synthase [Gammaproteobacteria bacterium HGW-Gammaproteobacteria-2]|nr:MAG: octaprenyl-diphosphate synthase [Gammaproteobacteria bacterium HGW-Gammaproteobacteria-2]
MPATTPVLSLPDAQRLCAADMAAVNTLIRQQLASDVVLINQIGEHIIGAGGKRLRPMLVLLAAKALGYQGHLRRGRKTANALWGNAASVLVGDFLYSRSFQMMVGLQRMAVMQVLADTTNAIAEGEVLQLLHVNNPDVDEAAYQRVIERKTAILFAAATRLGALVAGADIATQEAMADYGMHLGLAFQIADDVLDYTADAQALGKNLGDDLAEGKATLPVIHAIAHADAGSRARLRAIIEQGDVDALPELLLAIEQSGSIAYSLGRASDYARSAEQALSGLPETQALAALRGLARYAVNREH